MKLKAISMLLGLCGLSGNVLATDLCADIVKAATKHEGYAYPAQVFRLPASGDRKEKIVILMGSPFPGVPYTSTDLFQHVQVMLSSNGLIHLEVKEQKPEVKSSAIDRDFKHGWVVRSLQMLNKMSWGATGLGALTVATTCVAKKCGVYIDPDWIKPILVAGGFGFMNATAGSEMIGRPLGLREYVKHVEKKINADLLDHPTHQVLALSTMPNVEAKIIKFLQAKGFKLAPHNE